MTPRERCWRPSRTIKAELASAWAVRRPEGKLVEAQRIEQRTRFDLEMLQEVGHCKGIENYTRHLSRAPSRASRRPRWWTTCRPTR